MKDLTFICDGDSWTFGCEIVDPNVANKYGKNTHRGAYDYLEENDSYRIPRIFPTYIGNETGANIVNLSWPADDNTSILNRTIEYITTNYLALNKPTDKLFVIIGWSSPERNSFWYKDKDLNTKFRLWPNVRHFQSNEQEEIWNLYTRYLWNPEEYLPRYVMNVLQLQNFCNEHNIRWLCYNSFYQSPNKNINDWEDLDILSSLMDLDYKCGGYQYSTSKSMNRNKGHLRYSNIWNTIDPVRFYRKDKPRNTFKNFIEDSKLEKPFEGWHPSPDGHKIWCDELLRYIKENNI